MCCVDGGEFVESMWKFKVAEKVLEVCMMVGVRWYDVVGLNRKCWSGGGGNFCRELYEWIIGYMACWLADRLGARDGRDEGMG